MFNYINGDAAATTYSAGAPSSGTIKVSKGACEYTYSLLQSKFNTMDTVTTTVDNTKCAAAGTYRVSDAANKAVCSLCPAGTYS